MQLNYADYQHIYPDGSKDKERVGCAVLRENDHQTMRIPDSSSIFTAEAKAIDLALDLVDSCNSHDKFIIFSDSFSVLQALNHTSSKNPQIQNIFQKHHTISRSSPNTTSNRTYENYTFMVIEPRRTAQLYWMLGSPGGTFIT